MPFAFVSYFGVPKKKTTNIKTTNKKEAKQQQCWSIASAYECFNYEYRLNLIFEMLHAEFIIKNSDQRISH